MRTITLRARNGIDAKTAAAIGVIELVARKNPRGHCVEFGFFDLAQRLSHPLWGGCRSMPQRLCRMIQIVESES